MFLCAGYEVVLFDTQMSQLKTAQGYISSELENMKKEGATELIKKLTLSENLKEAMDGTIYVQVRCMSWVLWCVPPACVCVLVSVFNINKHLVLYIVEECW